MSEDHLSVTQVTVCLEWFADDVPCAIYDVHGITEQIDFHGEGLPHASAVEPMR